MAWQFAFTGSGWVCSLWCRVNCHAHASSPGLCSRSEMSAERMCTSSWVIE